MMNEPPEVTPWFFYNSASQIDDPLEFVPTTASGPATKPNATTENKTPGEVIEELDSPNASQSEPLSPPVFAAFNFAGSLVPTSASWTAFNPNDNKALETWFQDSTSQSVDEEVLVGQKGVYGVSLKTKLLKPVYWSSVKDTAHVKRSEWFFSTTLTPVDESLETALTAAYYQLRPWTQEYVFELKAALEVPDALQRISVPISYTLNTVDRSVPYKATVVFPPCYDGPLEEGDETVPAKFPVAHLLTPYLGASTLNPISLLTVPTTTQLISALLSGKTPPGVVQTLRQNFTWAEWKALRTLPDRPSDQLGYERPPVTQLVLVVHGIGQKLSEKVESFNFTYAINRFNGIMTELTASENVKQYLVENANVLALPVNWRRTLDFDALKRDTDVGPSYTLDQITMKTIPSVRNIITDVMLDIPFYMSGLKAHMVSATVLEANRIYRAFVKHNPQFDSSGRCHLIGHSLGSVIALDILSAQPYDVNKVTVDDKANFVFNTHNLFLAGSPAAFFLLLQSAKLTTRKSTDPPEESRYGSLAAKGVYNILHHSDPIAYLLNPTVDPGYADMIQTATLPGEKAFPLKSAQQSAGFFDSLKVKVFGSSPETPESTSRSSSVPRPPKSFLSGETIDHDLLEAINQASTAPTTGALSDSETELTEMTPPTGSPEELSELFVQPPAASIELEERDFTSLQAAEKCMYHLNPNGQIDFVIPLQGGPLDNQYLSMLSAHSGYWDNRDFARLVALECGRRTGVRHALAQFAAQKRKRK